MADYSKLTVAKLKDELKQRGLGTTGLKAVLVARLIEADQHSVAASAASATSAVAMPAPAPVDEEAGAQVRNEIAQAGEMGTEGGAQSRDGDVEKRLPVGEGKVEEELKVTKEMMVEGKRVEEKLAEDIPEEVKQAAEKETEDMPVEVTSNLKGNPIERTDVTEAMPAEKNSVLQSKAVAERVVAEDTPVLKEKSVLESQPVVEEHIAEDPNSNSKLDLVREENHLTHEANAVLLISQPEVVKHESQLSLPEETTLHAHSTNSQLTLDLDTASTEKMSTQTSINREEQVEDTRKRKRRSQSPPISLMDVAIKKAKTDDGSPRVTLPEDASSRDDGGAENDQLEAVANGASRTVTTSEGIQNEQVEHQDTEMLDGFDEAIHSSGTTKAEPRASLDTSKSTTKASPTDPRFKNLFPSKGKAATASLQRPAPHQDEREIPPSRHVATSAIYIRNFMRPLHPENLKSHLTSLAQAPNSSPNPNIISSFFLDSIRTHGLVQFTNVSAASRVRAALHDSVWPHERDRKPLFVDFVPEEKLAKWIEVERDSSSKGMSAKRWEVIYEEEEDGKMAAYLQEGDGAPRSFPKPLISRSNGDVFNIRNEHRTTSSPAISTPAAPRGDPGKGFKALDELFQSTAAKPKLYYQPMSASMAETRLEQLAAGRGGGRGNEMRRYTFEDDLIVDKGPEFGAGWRGGYRGRGGGFGTGVGAGPVVGYGGGGIARRGSRLESDTWRAR